MKNLHGSKNKTKGKDLMMATTAKHKETHEGRNRSRQAPIHRDQAESDYVRRQADRRWPTSDQEEKYFKMNTGKRADQGRAGGKRIAPREVTFPLLHELRAKVLNKLLVASSLKFKKVKRDPGFVLMRTYNLKNRPIVFI